MQAHTQTQTHIHALSDFRYAKAANQNFLRFGRSTDYQMKEDQHSSAAVSSSSSLKGADASISSPSEDSSYPKQGRTKRSVSAFYDDVEFIPSNSPSWASQYPGMMPASPHVFVDGASDGDFINDDKKRSYGRSFLRYGRDPLDLHFLRFGKRDTVVPNEDKTQEDEDQDVYTRSPKGRALKNFLRFG